MIHEVEEITKEIDSFKTNLLGLNGIIDYLKEINSQHRKNIEISDQQLIRINEYSDKLSKFSAEIAGLIESNLASAQNDISLSIRTSCGRLSEEIGALHIELSGYKDMIVSQNIENRKRQDEQQIEISQKIYEISNRFNEANNEMKVAMKRINSRFNLLSLLTAAILLMTLYSIVK